MKKLLFILIAIITVSCNKENNMLYRDIVGTYQFEHSEYGTLEFELRDFSPGGNRCVYMKDPRPGDNGWIFINGFILREYSDYVEVSIEHIINRQFFYFRQDVHNKIEVTISIWSIDSPIFEYRGSAIKI